MLSPVLLTEKPSSSHWTRQGTVLDVQINISSEGMGRLGGFISTFISSSRLGEEAFCETADSAILVGWSQNSPLRRKRIRLFPGSLTLMSVADGKSCRSIRFWTRDELEFQIANFYRAER